MLRHVAFLVCSFPALVAADAAKKPEPKADSKAVAAAKAYVAAMVDPKAPLPAVSAEQPQVHDTNSILKGCDSRGGTITTAEKLEKVKACFVVSWKDLKLTAKSKVTVEEKPYKDKTIGQDRLLKTLKDVPATSSIVSLTWQGKKEKEFSVTTVVDPEDHVRVVWMSWQQTSLGD